MWKASNEDMMRTFWSAMALSGVLFATNAAGAASAAEIKLLCPVAMQAVMPEITGPFERASGHKVAVEFATAGAIANRLLKGEAADVAIVSDPQMDELEKQGRIAAGGRKEIARVGSASSSAPAARNRSWRAWTASIACCSR